MRLDFSHVPLHPQAFSKKPMTFCDPEPKNALSAILDMIAIETGDPVARANWHSAQLTNLLSYAKQRSKFWKARIGNKEAGATLQSLSVLSRSDLTEQVEAEGSLLTPKDGIGTKMLTTSGSSG